MRYTTKRFTTKDGQPAAAVVEEETGRTALFPESFVQEAVQGFNDGTDDFDSYITHEAGYWGEVYVPEGLRPTAGKESDA